MNQPRTIYDVLSMLVEYHDKKYHDKKALWYRDLSEMSVDSQSVILLDHLLDLQTQSSRVSLAMINDD